MSAASEGHDPIRDAIQAALDAEGEGWLVSHYACIVGLDRVHDGALEVGATWLTTPTGQGGYVTDGLLAAALERRNDEKYAVDDE